MTLQRKRPENKSLRWTPRRFVRLYLDDVADVLAAMGKLGPVSADTGDFSGPLSDADELKRVGKGPLRALTLTVELPDDRSMRATLASDPPNHESSYGEEPVGTVITPGDDHELVGTATVVHKVIEERQTPFGGYNKIDWSFLIVALPLLFPVLVVVDTLARLAQVVAGLAILLVLGLTIMAHFRRNPMPGGVVITAYERDAPSFWRQNKSAILVNIITNVLVGALFYLLGLWQG